MFGFEPETAHTIASVALRFIPVCPPLYDKMVERYYVDHPVLRQEIFGRRFDNPVGLAAGFDKDAKALRGLFRLGFGFVEAGTVTPRPQAGNPRPR